MGGGINEKNNTKFQGLGMDWNDRIQCVYMVSDYKIDYIFIYLTIQEKSKYKTEYKH